MNRDPLDLTLRELLKHLTAPEPPWVNVRDELWPWRQLVAAAERGEVSISRVGRKLLMRREELDRWLDTQRIPAAQAKPAAPPADAHEANMNRLLAKAGFRRA